LIHASEVGACACGECAVLPASCSAIVLHCIEERREKLRIVSCGYWLPGSDEIAARYG
jgi:hypothetical protein